LSKFFFIIGTLLILSVFGLSTYQHELVHVFAYQKVGVETSIQLKDYQGIPAIATIHETKPIRDLTNLELANSYNESINYNLAPLLIGIMTMIFLGFAYIGKEIGDKK